MKLQKLPLLILLLILNTVSYVELNNSPSRDGKKHKLRPSVKRHVKNKHYKATRKSIKHDNDAERNITMLYDRVGSSAPQQLQHHILQQQQQQQQFPSQQKQHHKFLSHKTYRQHPTAHVIKRPFVTKTGTKRNFHGTIDHSVVAPSMSAMFASSKPLGTPVLAGGAEAPLPATLGVAPNVPVVPDDSDGHLQNPESPLVPLGPLSNFMKDGKMSLPQPIQVDLSDGSISNDGRMAFGPQPIQADLVDGSMPDSSPYITPHQTTFMSEPNHFFQKGILKNEGGITQGGYLQKRPVHMRLPDIADQSEDFMNTIIPHQTSFTSEPRQVYQDGVVKNQEGIAQGGYLQKYPLEMMGPGAEDRTEDVANTIVPHQTSYYDPPKHLFQPGVEKTQDGFVSGGFLQKYPVTMRAQGFHHIVRKPIHIMDPHATTYYETRVEQGDVHEHPCLNGGIYFSLKGLYQCICREEFIGKNCQDKNYCNPCPCQNKGTCHNIRDEPFYKCHCKVGFFGLNCDKKDPCFPNPCKNQGICTHDGETASCICNRRFRGKKCELLNNCNPDPCRNGGKCIEMEGEGKFQCDCLPMYRGTLCGSRSFCFINPCRNGGICREGDSSFICDCPKGFSGPACADRVCLPNPCMNGGTCIEDGDKFKCVCLPWTAGNLCEETRPCLTKPCMHGGRCIDSYSGFHWSFGPLQYYCLCKIPYKGMNCEYHGCQNCHKNAHCELDHCVCDEGYEGNGQTCRKVDNPCIPNPCMNKGVCMEVADYCSGQICGFKCACSDPYIPPLCKNKNPCNPDPCANGVCQALADGTFTCLCDPGFRGANCADKDACHPNPCQHHGQCKDNNGTATCSCPGEYKPPYCKECGCPYKSKDGSPTQFCSPEGACICPVGYTPNSRAGTCEKQLAAAAPLRPCQSNPCENGGTCMDVSETEFSCLCPKGASGKVCQHRSPCNPGPCLNGGTCREQDGKFMGCDCPSHYSPPLCKKPLALNGPCQPNPCQQGGICILNRDAYDCICPVRFTGPHCNVDKCSHCDAHAKCVNGKCKCNPGFIGTGYTCEREMCEATCVEWSTCVDGQCVCHPGYTYSYNQCIPKPIMPEEEEEEEEPVHPPSNNNNNIHLINPTSGIIEGTGPGLPPPSPVRPRPTARPDIVLPKKETKVILPSDAPIVTTPGIIKPPVHPPIVKTTPKPVVPGGMPNPPEPDNKLGPPGTVPDDDIMKGPPGSKRTIPIDDDQDEEDDAYVESSNDGKKSDDDNDAEHRRRRRSLLNY